MDDENPKKPFKRIFEGDFFPDIEDEFKRMEQYMNHVFNEAKQRAQNTSEEGSPYVYGFSMRVGPDGKPRIQEFGNTQSLTTTGQGRAGREPLTDCIEGEEEVTIIAEVPGIEKKDIELDIDGDSLVISVNTPTRKYYKQMPLPCPVIAESGKANYKNGVLEVKLKREETKQIKKRKIDVD